MKMRPVKGKLHFRYRNKEFWRIDPVSNLIRTWQFLFSKEKIGIQIFDSRLYELINDPLLSSRGIEILTTTAWHVGIKLRPVVELRHKCIDTWFAFVNGKKSSSVRCVHVVLDNIPIGEATNFNPERYVTKKPLKQAPLSFSEYAFATESYVQSMIEFGIERAIKNALTNNDVETQFVGFNSLMVKQLIQAISDVDFLVGDELICWLLESLRNSPLEWREKRYELFDKMFRLESRIKKNSNIMEICRELFPSKMSVYFKDTA